MTVNTNIEWTDATWNPVSGCTWASPGCDNCYAVTMTRRLEAMGQEKYTGLTTHKHFNGTVKLHPNALDIPKKWRKPKRIFVNSMSDLFHKDVPFEFIDAVFAVMAVCPQHTFQILTKRPERMAEYLRYAGKTPLLPLSNVWLPLSNVQLLTSSENQGQADKRTPKLLKCRDHAAVLGLSIEPLLGPIDFFNSIVYQADYYCGICRTWYDRPDANDHCPNCGNEHTDEVCPECKYDGEMQMVCPECGIDGGNGGLSHSDCCQAEIAHQHKLDWVIVGGESGPHARPFDLAWAESLLSQCQDAGVPFFLKQLGSNPVYHGKPIKLKDPKGGNWDEWPYKFNHLKVRQFPREKN